MEATPNLEYNDLIFNEYSDEIDSNHFEEYLLSPNVQDLNKLDQYIVRTILTKEVVTKKIRLKN